MPYQNEGHIFAVISKRRSYIISKWKSLWEHTPPFFCLFATETAWRDLSTVRSRTEGLLFTNPGSAAKISLAEERRMTDKTSSLRESLFSRLYGVWYDLNTLFVSYQIADSRNTPSGVNKKYIRLNCKKSGASYQNENHCHFKTMVRKGIVIPSVSGCHFLSFYILQSWNALAITAPDTVRRRRFYLTSCYRNGDLSKCRS